MLLGTLRSTCIRTYIHSFLAVGFPRLNHLALLSKPWGGGGGGGGAATMPLKYVHTPFLVKSLFSSQSAESTRLQFTPNQQSLSRLRQWAVVRVSRHSCVSSCSACHVRMHF